MADPGPAPEDGGFLTPLIQSLLTAAGIMGTVSFVILPLCIRFILTPLLFRKVCKKSMVWEDETSRLRAESMIPILKQRLMSSDGMNPIDDMKALLEQVSPADENGIIHLDFTPIRFLEIILMAYEDVYSINENSIILRYLLKRRISWYKPFHRGYKAGKIINRFRFLRFMNKKGLVPQIIRLILVPFLGIPGILFYSFRSVFVRLFWEGFIRNFYLRLLFRASHYILYLYGGDCIELEKRKDRFSKKEIIRKGNHFDRELSIIPDFRDKEDVLAEMIRAYSEILLGAGLTPDTVYTLKPNAHRKRVRIKGKLSGLLRKTISAVHEEINGKSESPSLKEILLDLSEKVSRINFPGKERPRESYRLNQVLSASYKLSIIALGAVYANAPGSHFALEKISVDLFRKVRDFSRQPLVALMKDKGMESWKSIRPVLRIRKILKMRKVSPAGMVSLGMPLFGRILQDKGKEILLYRLGRAMIRYSLTEEKELPDP